MKAYVIERMPAGAGAAKLAGEFDPCRLPDGFGALREARIDAFPWDDCGYRPEAFARVGWDENGLCVLMAAREPVIRAEVLEVGGAACEDSCLEFFLQPAPGRSARYVNVEATPRAVLHIGLGEGRHGRRVLRSLPEGVCPSASRHSGGWWAVSYALPAAFLRDEFGARLQSGEAMRGNFYKCCDLTAHPHWGMWAPYALPEPDFHRPELFAPMMLR